MNPTQSPKPVDTAVLHPLTPKYQPEKHEVYFSAIKDALGWTGDDTVRNIALTGSYGVGKSSILRQVATDPDLKVIQVSLSTLGFGSPEQPTNASSTDDNDDERPNPLRETKTNQIQKEIVKQLLYTQMPEKMPGSRYRRTSAFRPRRELLFALVAGLPVALAFFLLGWTSKLALLFTVPTEWAIAANAGMALIAAAFVFGMRYVTHNKLRISSVSTGAATIQLSAASDTYFDEYLDEIVYFFQVVDADLVIFEDIDRFEDAHIFETLRELNTILNTAKQLNGRVIRFLYAIKDSIFEELGTRAAREANAGPDAPSSPITDAAMLEVARANRTKFFDLVIPVVPFVTHQSARELMASELSGLGHTISDNLIDLVAQHVPDMRLIKNIRNEFVIFRKQVIEESSLELTDDALFAMVLYKSTHLSDFEQIKLGKSGLDTLYGDSRKLITAEIARLNAEILNVRKAQRAGASMRERSARFGEAVDNYINRLLGHHGARRLSLRYLNEEVDAATLRGSSFWIKYVANPKDLSLVFRDVYRGDVTTSIVPAEVEVAIGEKIDPNKWRSIDETEADRKVAAARADIKILGRADMSDLVGRLTPTLEIPSAGSVTFASRTKQLLGSSLAVALVEQGYIDRYFTLYTSTFVGELVNANAMNFIIKNVDTGAMDIHFELSAEEAKAILRARPRLALREKSAYNLDFVDYLLTYDTSSAKTVLTNLRRSGGDERDFLQAYLASERDPMALVQSLARGWADILTFLVDDVELEDERRVQAVDAAFLGLSEDVAYIVSEGVARYIEENYGALKAFTDTKTTAIPSRVADVVDAADLLVPDLRILSERVRAAVIDVERFIVSRSNLLEAVAPSTDLSLNALKANSSHAYNRSLNDLENYRALLLDDEPTIDDPESFVAIVDDVARVDPASLATIVRRSSETCHVSNLDEIDSLAWPALAAAGRFDATYEDVNAYIEKYDLDANLATVLNGGEITVPADVEDDARVALAQKLLTSGPVLPSPELRVSLLTSLALPNPFEANEVPAEPGEWIGRLIESEIIADDADSFAVIPSDDWVGLEYALRLSKSITDFVDPAILPPKMIVRFLDSSRLDSDLKRSVIRRFEEFAEGAGRDVVSRMASYALDNGIALEWGAVRKAASSRVPSSIVLRMLQRFNTTVTLDHLRPILTALGGDYPLLLEANGRRPRFPNTSEVIALLERLKTLGTVNTVVAAGSSVKANMKKN